METHQCRINVLNRQKFVVHLMNLFVFQTTFFEISKCKIKQSVAAQYATDCSLKNIGDFIVEDFRCVSVLS